MAGNSRRRGAVRTMTGLLGLDPLDPRWTAAGSDDAAATALAALVDDLLAQRQAARARKDYGAADAIRDQLAKLGVVVEDTPQGPRWELSR